MYPESQPGSLAERLRRLRLDAGLTGDQLALALSWPEATGRSKVSKIENDRQQPDEDNIRDWARVTGHPELADDLLDLLAGMKVSRKRWRQGLRSEGAAAVQAARNQRTAAATRIRNVETVLIPGMLQTSGYAQAVFESAALLYGAVDVAGAVQKRMDRQQLLYDQSKTFEFITTEAALYLMPCPARVMAGQLDRLLSLSMDNVAFGIIPFTADLALLPINGFLLSDDVLTVETLAGSDEETGEAAALAHRTFDLLMGEALTGEDMRRLIMRAADRLRSALRGSGGAARRGT